MWMDSYYDSTRFYWSRQPHEDAVVEVPSRSIDNKLLFCPWVLVYRPREGVDSSQRGAEVATSLCDGDAMFVVGILYMYCRLISILIVLLIIAGTEHDENEYDAR